MIELFAAGKRDQVIEDKVNVAFWFKELMLCYKFGEKFRYEKALNILRPYMSDQLVLFYEDILQNSYWKNPITGKKGY